MKLSEAIKLGATLGPQLRNGNMFAMRDGALHTCALGAAAVAVGIEVGFDIYPELVKVFPQLDAPQYGDGNRLLERIWQMNDGNRVLGGIFMVPGGMTREQIADWLVESGNDCEAVLPEVSEEVEKPVEVAA